MDGRWSLPQLVCINCIHLTYYGSTTASSGEESITFPSQFEWSRSIHGRWGKWDAVISKWGGRKENGFTHSQVLSLDTSEDRGERRCGALKLNCYWLLLLHHTVSLVDDDATCGEWMAGGGWSAALSVRWPRNNTSLASATAKVGVKWGGAPPQQPRDEKP